MNRWGFIRSGNVGMLCKSLLESLKSGVKFKDPESTFCLTNRTFNWFNTTDSLQLHQLEMMQRVQDECPENCTCELDRLNFDLNNTERKTITARVDCSGLGLTKFPEKLPSGTVTLNVSNNNVSLVLCAIFYALASSLSDQLNV